MHTKGDLLQRMILVQKREALAGIHPWDANKLHSLLLQKFIRTKTLKTKLNTKLERKVSKGRPS